MGKVERSTKGRRLQQQTEEELEADNNFWGQESFREEEQDENYLTEDEPEDIVDSDFDKSENENEEEDEEQGDQVKERKKADKKKSQKYLETIPGMKKAISLLRKKKRQEKEKQEREEQLARLKQKEREEIEEMLEDEDSEFEEDVRRSIYSKDKLYGRKEKAKKLRKSTLKKATAAEMERLERLEELEYSRPKKKKKALVSKKMSIRQVMREAAVTEWDNLASLELLMAQEEEVKQKAIVQQKETIGPVIRYKSMVKNGQEHTTLSILNCEIPEEYQAKIGEDYPPKPFCAITQQPARYLDPITRTPYANVDVYKILYPSMDDGQQYFKKKQIFGQLHMDSLYSEENKLDFLSLKYLKV